MKTDIISKHAIIGRAPAEIYMMFSDMRNFVQFIPADKREGIRADFDNIYANVQGFDLGVTVAARQPYSRIDFKDNGGPFPFSMSLFFSATPEADPAKTDFHIELSAELNIMMKMLLGNKLQDALNKVVDGLQAVSEGRMPEGVSAEDIEKYKSQFGL